MAQGMSPGEIWFKLCVLCQNSKDSVCSSKSMSNDVSWLWCHGVVTIAMVGEVNEIMTTGGQCLWEDYGSGLITS